MKCDEHRSKTTFVQKETWLDILNWTDVKIVDEALETDLIYRNQFLLHIWDKSKPQSQTLKLLTTFVADNTGGIESCGCTAPQGAAHYRCEHTASQEGEGAHYGKVGLLLLGNVPQIKSISMKKGNKNIQMY